VGAEDAAADDRAARRAVGAETGAGDPASGASSAVGVSGSAGPFAGASGSGGAVLAGLRGASVGRVSAPAPVDSFGGRPAGDGGPEGGRPAGGGAGLVVRRASGTGVTERGRAGSASGAGSFGDVTVYRLPDQGHPQQSNPHR
jgi:hypothetical protein